jgi:hypothetical protein
MFLLLNAVTNGGLQIGHRNAGVEHLKAGVKWARKTISRFKHEHIQGWHSMQAANGVHLSVPPSPIVSQHLRRLGQPKIVANAAPGPQTISERSCTPSFVSVEVDLSNEPTSARAGAS